jgi:hypothetical protein
MTHVVSSDNGFGSSGSAFVQNPRPEGQLEGGTSVGAITLRDSAARVSDWSDLPGRDDRKQYSVQVCDLE